MANNTMNFGVDLLPTIDNNFSLGNSNKRWKINGNLTASKITLPPISGTGTTAVDQGSSNTTNRYKPAVWTFSAGITPVDGDVITIRQPCAGHDYGTWLTVDEGSSYHPIVYNTSDRITTHFATGQAIMLMYDSTGTASVYAHEGAMSRTTVTGVWRVLNTYNTNNNDIGYYHRRIYSNLKAGGPIHPYSIIMQLPNGRWSSITATAPNNPTSGTISPISTGKNASTSGYVLGHVLLMYARVTYADGNNIANYNIWSAHSNLIDARYSFNLENSSTKGFTAYAPVYLVGTLNNSGLFILDNTQWWTQTLPTVNNGKIYIYIGDAYDWYRMTFTEEKPIYWYKDGKVQLFSGASSYAVNADSWTNDRKVYTDLGTASTTTTINGGASNAAAIGIGVNGTLGAGNGGTGKTNLTDAANALINALGTGSSNLTANDYVITQYVGGGTTTTTYHRRPASAVINATLVKAALGTDSSTTNQWLNKKGEWKQLAVSDISGLGTMATETAANYLKWQTTTKKSTELYDFGVYVNQGNAVSTGPSNNDYFALLNIPYRKSSGNTKMDWGWQIAGNTDNNGRLWYRTTGNNTAENWQEIAHAPYQTSDIGSTTQPVYMTASGVITVCSVYAGGTAVTLNNSSKAASTASFYAPTAGGTANTQALVGNGTTSAPKWVDISPSITIGAGTDSAAPTVNVTVLGQSGTAKSITTASTSVYGVTKLNDGISSNSTTLAATANAAYTASRNSLHTLGTTTKFYLTGCSSSTTNTAGDIFDTGIYSTTTAGELSAVRHTLNLNGTDKAYMTWNNTDQSIDFVFN